MSSRVLKVRVTKKTQKTISEIERMQKDLQQSAQKAKLRREKRKRISRRNGSRIPHVGAPLESGKKPSSSLSSTSSSSSSSFPSSERRKLQDGLSRKSLSAGTSRMGRIRVKETSEGGHPQQPLGAASKQSEDKKSRPERHERDGTHKIRSKKRGAALYHVPKWRKGKPEDANKELVSAPRDDISRAVCVTCALEILLTRTFAAAAQNSALRRKELQITHAKKEVENMARSFEKERDELKGLMRGANATIMQLRGAGDVVRQELAHKEMEILTSNHALAEMEKENARKDRLLSHASSAAENAREEALAGMRSEVILLEAELFEAMEDNREYRKKLTEKTKEAQESIEAFPPPAPPMIIIMAGKIKIERIKFGKACKYQISISSFIFIARAKIDDIVSSEVHIKVYLIKRERNKI